METVADMMRLDIQPVTPGDSIARALQRMQQHEVASLPVCQDGRLLGIINRTAIAGVMAAAKQAGGGEALVGEIMTEPHAWCFADQTLAEALQQIGETPIGLLPVLNHDRQLVGVVLMNAIVARHAVLATSAQENAKEGTDGKKSGCNDALPHLAPYDGPYSRF